MSPSGEGTPLSRERIVDAAIALADAEGLGAVTMRRLAASLDAGAMSLYRHFRNKEELLDAVGDAVIQPAVLEEIDLSVEWTDVARSVVHGFRAALLEHPGVAPLLIRRPPFGPNTFVTIERCLTWLRAVGFDEREAPRAFQALLTYVLAAVSLEAPYRWGDGPGVDEHAASLRAQFATLSAGTYPATASMLQYLFVDDSDVQFDYGLDLLLTGLAARLGGTDQDRRRPT